MGEYYSTVKMSDGVTRSLVLFLFIWAVLGSFFIPSAFGGVLGLPLGIVFLGMAAVILLGIITSSIAVREYRDWQRDKKYYKPYK